VPALLHDASTRDSIRGRIQQLRADSPRRWGKMSVDQMLWHVNQSLANALGDFRPKPVKMPLPGPLIKFFALNMPWPRGAPTAPEFKPGERYSFEAERARCLALIDRVVAKRIDDPQWEPSAGFGIMSGRDWSRLQAKHLDHHLRQFSV
jgi:hypothetical protein